MQLNSTCSHQASELKHNNLPTIIYKILKASENIRNVARVRKTNTIPDWDRLYIQL